MPYACFTFDNTTSAGMHGVTQKLQNSSAFVPESPFHVPLIGSLHVYSQEVVFAAFDAVYSSGAALTGRFLAWEIKASQLRCTVALDSADAIVNRLHTHLPQGKPWRAHYVVLGSVAAIEASRHAEFLAAVEAAFPVADATFAANKLEFHIAVRDKPLPSKSPDKTSTSSSNEHVKMDVARPKKALNHAAQPFVPGSGPKAAPHGKQGIKKKARSPHRKWERAGAAPDRTGRSAVDALIQSHASSTGSTGGRTATGSAARTSAAERKAAIAKARQGQRAVWVSPSDPSAHS